MASQENFSMVKTGYDDSDLCPKNAWKRGDLGMVLGKGLIARAFAKYWERDPDVAVIAAGVSNSAEVDEGQFSRERRMLEGVLAARSARVVYFSSCAAGNPLELQSAYLKHKIEMERLVLTDPRGLVLRLPQVVGRGGNPHTLTNFLAQKINSGEAFEVWADAERNIVDVEDVAIIGTQAIRWAEQLPRVISIADLESTNMLTIVHMMEKVLGKCGRYTVSQKGTPFPIDTSVCATLEAECRVPLGSGYLYGVLETYYGNSSPGRNTPLEHRRGN